MRVKDLFNIMPGEQLVRIATFDFNLDTEYLTDVHHVYYKDIFSTHFQKRVLKMFNDGDVIIIYI